MSSNLGRVTARLAEPTDSLPPEMVALINQNIKPPTPVTAEEIYVRAMYIVSDQVNSFGGRFPIDEHGQLAQLLVDSPLLVGHRKDRLPVGRNFHAELVERDGHPWIKCYFYWLRSSAADEQLADNIDGGIYKECSIAFTFNLPACSICGRDIRRCEHEPFESYDNNGTKTICHFDYREIEKVLETSLVYRGAIPETSITKTLADATGNEQASAQGDDHPRLTTLDSIQSLDRDKSYLIVPLYDGLPLTACLRDGALSMVRWDGQTLAADLADEFRPAAFRVSEPIYGMLIGYRGRERCSRKDLERYLNDRSGPVSRLVLNVYPQQGLLTLPRSDPGARLQIRIVPHRIASHDNLEQNARQIMTRDGVEIWPLAATALFPSPNDIPAFKYHPTNENSSTKPSYRLEARPGSNRATLIVTGVGPDSQSSRAFELAGFDLALLRRGRRFVARPMSALPCPTNNRSTLVLEGRVLQAEQRNGALIVQCAGESCKQLTLRPIRLGGRDLFLFSISSDTTTPEVTDG